MGRHSFIIAMVLCNVTAAAAQMQVVSTSPSNNATAATTDSVSVTFDRAVNTGTVTAATFRVFGRVSGTKSGVFTFSNANQTVTLNPTEDFAAGETVLVNLSHDIIGADTVALRSAGYVFYFGTETQSAGLNFQQIDVMSNRGPTVQTRIYGAMSSDLNHDGYADLTTVNEVSSDLRVFLNKGDGTGEYFPYLTPPLPIGLEASPNEPADFDNDGDTDICVSATDDDSIWIALGNGNGTFAAAQEVAAGDQPHGVAVLDVDGDGDLDIVNANGGSNDLSLSLNNGSGVFGAVSFFDSGLDGEYGLATGDANGDGISDLIVGANNGQQVRTLLGNGNGTFTPAAAQSSGGWTWVVVTGDINGDGDLDVAAANSFSGNVGILLGNGDGTFAAPSTIGIGSHLPSVDLGDLDGDGDLDVVASSFGGGFWRVFTNNGSGAFTFDQEITAPDNPSCSILVDFDNDGDLDMALTDEIADVVVLMKNGPVSPLPCPPTPSGTCRLPAVGGKATLKMKAGPSPNSHQVLWKWLKGDATTKLEFGDPINTDDYTLCIYDNNALISTATAEAGGTCPSVDCWSDASTGYRFKDPDRDPFGVQKILLKEGTAGKAKILFLGKGGSLDTPDLSSVSGPIDVELHKSSGGICWGATYSAPFVTNDGENFKDKAD